VYLLDGQREVMFSNQNAFLLGKFDSNMRIDTRRMIALGLVGILLC
jgi:hypothetical protein